MFLLLINRFFADEIIFAHPSTRSITKKKKYSSTPLIQSQRRKIKTRLDALYNERKLITMAMASQCRLQKNRTPFGASSSNLVEQCNADESINSRSNIIRSYGLDQFVCRKIMWFFRLNYTRYIYIF